MLIAIVFITVVACAFAFKARDNVYYYQTTSASGITYRSVLVPFFCTGNAETCVYAIGGQQKTLYGSSGGGYTTVYRFWLNGSNH